ncbi:MAG TPA: MspA family porin [Gordonia sp. (in: high G+C Gram-positive bacteria)]|uniref:MspA family porin n=1 Tax=unclassified Gordonia (in: high G+C Gram-positive bacteria) TaxID=2657482 RepID=UPI0025C01BCF|nr:MULTISPECIES: MspA family porin [unclassified Gordonia (in: high G+C Gram-positive bacteria)]HNP57909.1 MspA family porin [Gordonia sp. (in: high G+C Gram-positive bacteria)]HRC51498.1 MspA family porin [Gordonia sp. (in: high G+C Gram-positive bacteria)]
MTAIRTAWKRRSASILAVGTAAVVALAGMGVGEATAARLPNGYKRTTGIDGQVVTLKRVNEFAFAQESGAFNAVARSAQVAGTFTARINRGGGNVQVGYQVGCQVNVGGIDVGLTGGLYLPLSTNTTASPLPIIGGSLNFPVQPGQVVVVKVLNKDFKKKVVSLQLSGVEMTVQSCGGYAQARSFITVLATDNYSTEGGTVTGNSGAIQTTLYGTPFSLG